MPRLLVAHHTPSPATQEMLEAVLEGARHDAIEGVEVIVRPALVCSEVEVLQADGYLPGSRENIGYMSGALKHLFDRIYYPRLDATRGRPFGLFVHDNQDTGGAVSAVEQITGALGWRAGGRHTRHRPGNAEPHGPRRVYGTRRHGRRRPGRAPLTLGPPDAAACGEARRADEDL